MEKQFCRNCDAFFPDPANGERGSCHAKPPTAMAIPMTVPGSVLSPTGPQMGIGIQGAHPPTAAASWCREWANLRTREGVV